MLLSSLPVALEACRDEADTLIPRAEPARQTAPAAASDAQSPPTPSATAATRKRYTILGPRVMPDPHMTRERALEQARHRAQEAAEGRSFDWPLDTSKLGRDEGKR